MSTPASGVSGAGSSRWKTCRKIQFARSDLITARAASAPNVRVTSSQSTSRRASMLARALMDEPVSMVASSQSHTETDLQDRAMTTIKDLIDNPQELADDQRIVDATAASLACVTLINAYCRNPEHVDWEDVQLALDHALRAFRLPGNYPEKA